MSGDGAEKKHPATPRKRQQAHERGQVAKSHDLASAGCLMTALLALRYLGKPLYERIASQWSDSFASGLDLAWTLQDAVNHLAGAAALIAFAVLPLLSVMFIAGIVANLSQTGVLMTTSALTPDFRRASPLAGLHRIFSTRGLMRLAFGLFKIIVIAAVTWLTLKTRSEALLTIWSQPLPILANSLATHLFDVCIRIAAALLSLGLLDYGFQRWRHEEDLKMTDQELKEELKESQGGNRQTRRTQAAEQPTGAKPWGSQPTATVTVTDPDGLTISLSFTPGTATTPIVIEKGKMAAGRRLLQLAKQRGVPVVIRPQLTTAMYAQAEPGQPIPIEQFRAVAELLQELGHLRAEGLHLDPAKPRGHIGSALGKSVSPGPTGFGYSNHPISPVPSIG